MVEPGRNSWIGRTLGGRYQILDVLGEGGMGIVYRAKQTSIERDVAIKMLHAKAASDPKQVQRFHQEAKSCSQLTHPNTVRLYDFGQTTLGNLYMVMELLNGSPLSHVIRSEAPLAPARTLRILMQCAASLSEAHSQGIVHRDIKPDNIFLVRLPGARDFIKLLDFSIAKNAESSLHTATGVVFGTPQYMSPEQTAGRPLDGRSDIYSLGIVAYEMLSGKVPFQHQLPLEILKMHQSAPVPPLPSSVPDPVAKLVYSCLEKDKENRPESALALLEAAKVWLSELDPGIDMAADPVLKNTLISAPTEAIARGKRDSQAPTLMGTPSQIRRRGPDTQAKTLLHGQAPTVATAAAAIPVKRPTSEADTVLQGEPPKITAQQQSLEAKAKDKNATMIATPRPSQQRQAVSLAAPVQAARSQGAKPKSSAMSRPPGVPHSTPDLGSHLEELQKRPEMQAHQAQLAKAAAAPAAQLPPPPSQAQAAASPQAMAPAASSLPRLDPAMATSTAAVNLPRSRRGPDSDNLPAQRPASGGKAGFLLLCLIVAATFGLGSYYLVSTLR